MQAHPTLPSDPQEQYTHPYIGVLVSIYAIV
jgi:hypothetical protein